MATSLRPAIHSQELRDSHHPCCHDLGGTSQAAMTREAGGAKASACQGREGSLGSEKSGVGCLPRT